MAMREIETTAKPEGNEPMEHNSTLQNLVSPPADPDEDEIVSMGETCRFLVFSTIFVVILLNQLTTETSYLVASTARSLLIDEDFDEINSHQDVREWFVESYVPAINQIEAYPGQNNFEEAEYPRFAWFNRMLTPLRFVQKRVELTDNPYDRTNDDYPNIWATNLIELTDSNVDGESTDNFGSGTGTYCQGLDETIFEYSEEKGFSQAGGFQFLLDLQNTDERAQDCVSSILEDSLWVDSLTASVGSDFVLYNAHHNLLVYVEVSILFSNAGRVENTFFVRSIKTNFYITFLDFVRAGLELIYVMFIVYYTVIEVLEIKNEYETECRNKVFELRQEREELGEDLEESNDKLNCIEKVKVFFMKALPEHLKDVWNILDITSLIFSYISIFMWIEVLTLVPDSDSDLDESFIDSVRDSVFALSTYVKINAINLLLVFFRVIKYLRRFERVRLLQHTFQRAGGEIIYFFILLTAIFFSFVIFGLLAFGNTNGDYSTLLNSITSSLLLLLNDIGIPLVLLESNFVLAALYIIMFTLLINFILTNMFIAIISTAYGDKLEEFYKIKERQQATEKVHICTEFKEKAVNAALAVAGKCCKKRMLNQRYKERMREREEQFQDQVIRVDDFEIEYQQAKQWSADINPEVLSDKEKYQKIAAKNKNLSRQLCAALIFVVFALIYIIVLVQQQDVPQKYALAMTLRESLSVIDYADDLQLDEIDDFSTLSEWFMNGFPKVFDLEHGIYFDRGNYLVGQNIAASDICTSTSGPMRLTVRRVEVEENDVEDYEEYQDVVRKNAFGPTKYSFDELEDTLKLDACEWKHQEDTGLLGEGGYVFHVELGNFGSEFARLLENDRFLNDTVNSLTVSCVLFNPSLAYFTYMGLSFTFDSSGKINQDIYIKPMLFKVYQVNGADIIRAILECLFVLLLVYHITLSGKTIYRDYKNYEHWRSRFYGILTQEQIYKRNRAKPEWLRRITNILTPYVIVDLLSYTCSIACIIYWLKFMLEPATNTELPVSDTDFHDEFGEESETARAYMNWSAFNVFFLFLRILNYLTIKKGLRFLQDTISRSMSDIFYFLIMLFVILMGYMFMGYFVFGHTLEKYSSITRSFMACFSIIIGDFDYEELKETDQLMSFIFFFTLAILATYILLNIFIAILERAFNMVKEQAGRAQETTYISFFLTLLKKSVIEVFKRPHQDPKEKLNAQLAAGVFKRIDTGDEDQDTPSYWGTEMADELLMERNKREEVMQPLEDLFQKRKEKEIEDIQLLFKQKEELKDEIEARFAYWDYLRIGMLRLSEQQAKLVQKRQEIALEKAARLQPYRALKNAIEEAKATLAETQNELDALKMDLAPKKSKKN